MKANANSPSWPGIFRSLASTARMIRTSAKPVKDGAGGKPATKSPARKPAAKKAK